MTKKELVAFIRPLPDAVWQADYPLSYLEGGLTRLAEGLGEINMTPDFQRGHVWTNEQQLRFCEAFVRKFIPGHLLTFQFNCPFWNNNDPSDLPREIQCIDGLQRLTALRTMMNGDIKPFGFNIEEFDGTELQIRRISRCVKIQMHAFKKKKDLLQYYLDVNEGATPHTPEELQRVRAMLESSK